MPWAGIGLAVALVFQLGYFLKTLRTPWMELNDFNGAVWAQAAHNFLAAGFVPTAGVPAPFYFGLPPVPEGAFYCHHPSLLSWMVAAAFALFGETEWSARLVPVLFSTASVVLLWLLVKNCAGRAAAGWCALIFVALPMELRFGQMVNFEPCALTWMLAGFLGLRRAEQTGGWRWKVLAMGGFGMAMLTAWLGYFVAGALLLDALWRGKRRFALGLLGMALVSGGLFLFQMRLAEPTLFDDLATASLFRFGHRLEGGLSFTLAQWAARVFPRLLENLPALFVALAVAGMGCLWDLRRREGARWLGWLCLIMGGMNAVYFGGFRNASYIHDYAAFYFAVPVAVLAGVAGARFSAAALRRGRVMGMALCGALAAGVMFYGGWRADSLRAPARVLDVSRPEPEGLVPELGRLVRSEFPPGARVLTNIGANFTPQFWYYASHPLESNLTRASHWRVRIPQNAASWYGLVWLGAPGAAEIVRETGASQRKEVWVEGVPFCVLKTEPAQMAGGSASSGAGR